MKHRPELDGLRGIAILIVLGAHTGVPGFADGGGGAGVVAGVAAGVGVAEGRMSFASRAASASSRRARPRMCSHQKGRKKLRYAVLMVRVGVVAICTTYAAMVAR